MGSSKHTFNKKSSNNRFEEYAKSHPDVRFFHGLLGEFNPQLPQNYFDMIFSVTSIKSVLAERLPKFFEETYLLLRPGGMAFHSYDVYYRQPVRVLYDEYEKAGFEWLKPKETMNVFWEDWLCESSVGLIDSVLPYVMMENPMVVAENYMWQQKREERNQSLELADHHDCCKKAIRLGGCGLVSEFYVNVDSFEEITRNHK
ncbi:MAG: class I SAM-dependent methyltransferase [Ignavibacteria bacterium]|nr:class I SAM-dependent methyltransferase [Ignavibacteria bacterium]